MRIVVTVVGKDKVGIIYKVTGILAESKVNVLNISQSIVDGFFNMILIADMAGAATEIGTLRERLDKLAGEIGVEIRVQSEDIFTAMHQI
ncbi:MAG: ACT domain-containing protein [Acidaminococcaceae bacterium]|jgi:ACT domain-containing protein|nr:ACT domain-containing protein [Acidaminococcaceae bacterium]HAY61820.1 ACT domain-containing protein [Acidaminococcaceae bacterium]HCJ90625.1 ACT domain-containing protein [Acidaminococcaceae bacterium]